MNIQDWELIHYELATRKQLELVDAVASGEAEETLVLCTHPPVVTLGRATSAEDLIGWQGETYETSRGGRATYHGPNQLVIYPIIDLRKPHKNVAERDLHQYLRALENATVSALHELGLKNAEARITKQGELSLTGVWVGEKKIASIGIAVRKWITYHGVAINIFHDDQAFQGIRPCGFSSASVMTSVERELSAKPDFDSTKAILIQAFNAM